MLTLTEVIPIPMYGHCVWESFFSGFEWLLCAQKMCVTSGHFLCQVRTLLESYIRYFSLTFSIVICITIYHLENIFVSFITFERDEVCLRRLANPQSL